MSRKGWSQILTSSSDTNTNNTKSNTTAQSKKGDVTKKGDVSASVLDTYVYTPYGGKDALIKMLNHGRVVVSGNSNDLSTVLTTVSGCQLPANNSRSTNMVNNIGVMIQNCGNGYMAYFGDLRLIMTFSLYRGISALADIAKNAMMVIAMLGNRMEVTFADINKETVTILMSLITASNANNCVIK